MGKKKKEPKQELTLLMETTMSADRHDEGKIELHHIHPVVWRHNIVDWGPNPRYWDWIYRMNLAIDDFFYCRNPLPLLELVSSDLLRSATPVLSFGAKKYASLNYVKGMKYSRVLNSLRRHTLALIEGEELDPENGLPHEGHIACNYLFLATYHLLGYDGGEFDDRPDLGSDTGV